jgi:phage terminase large subunit-like protein
MDEAPPVNPWRTAVPDWEERLRAGASLVPNLPLFREEADRALRIFKRLRIPDLIGKPTMAEACGPFFFPIVEAMFGCYDPATHRRMIQEFFWLIPKKNGKSSTGGPLMLTAAIMNRRPEAEFDVIAPTIQIAQIAFRQAMGTVKVDPELDKLFQCRPHVRAIQHRRNGTVLQIKAADTDVVTGGKQVGTMIDETHVFAARANAADVFVEIRGALAARPDGFLFQTTTQSKSPPAGIFKREMERARDVRDGMIDLPILPILYEYPSSMIDDGSWRERRNWGLVNPNLNRSVDEEFLARELANADREGREQILLIASQHFNIEIGLRMRGDAWAGAELWETAADPTLTLATLRERCDVVTVGIDGGGADDLLGACFIGRDRETRRWLAVYRAWAHTTVLERRKEIASAIEDFAEQGALKICDEAGDDLAELAAEVAPFNDAGLLPEKYAIGMDSFGVAAIADALVAAGISRDQLAAVQQGGWLSGTIKGMERRLRDGSFRHDGSPMMAWCVGNARAEVKGSNLLITKQTAGSAKIDPLIAGFNAFSLMARSPEAAGRTSIYRTERMMVL